MLADVSLRAQHRLFEAAGGELLVGHQVEEVVADGSGVRLGLDDGGTLCADAVVKDGLFSALTVIVVVVLAAVVGPKGPTGPPDPALLGANPRPDWPFLISV